MPFKMEIRQCWIISYINYFFNETIDISFFFFYVHLVFIGMATIDACPILTLTGLIKPSPQNIILRMIKFAGDTAESAGACTDVSILLNSIPIQMELTVNG
jgi:hypothetical protein